jgi:hypothetical protein
MKSATNSPLKTLESMILSKDCPIDVREVSYEFMKQVGGPKGLVRLIMLEYNESKVGGLARARILDIMMRLFQSTSPKGGSGDLGHMTEADLELILKEKLAAVGLSAVKVAHGQETSVANASHTAAGDADVPAAS